MRLALLLLVAALSGLTACRSGSSEAARLASEGLEEARAHRLEQAIILFDRAIALDPANLKALYNGGLARVFLRQGEAASRLFQAYVEERPKDPLGHFNLARAHALAYRSEETIASLRRAVELGFEDHDELVGGGFEAVEDDLRFAQIEALVAQRVGKLSPTGRGHGEGAYGGEKLRAIRLPGTRGGGACAARSRAPLASLDPMATAETPPSLDGCVDDAD